jgi:hypothetical protein
MDKNQKRHSRRVGMSLKKEGEENELLNENNRKNGVCIGDLRWVSSLCFSCHGNNH